MTVLVTGAAGAIGAAIVARLLEDGHGVIAHDLRTPAADRAPGSVMPISGDLADGGGLGAQLEEVGQELDAIIAAHGVDGSGALCDLDDAFVRRVLRINAASVPALLTAVRPHLRRPAVFVVVGSQAGLVGEPNNAAYCASKFGVHGWALAASDEDVAVRVLAPGCTESPLLYDAQARFAAARGVSVEHFVDERRARIPLRRFATARQTAAAAVYLAGLDGPRPALLAATGGEVLR
ncbi:MAG: SDR family NAD(P)-dependent oxidoreductase [Solirubrobacteraceae bacterium]